MVFEFKNLDETTRLLMLKEFDSDVRTNSLYISSRLNEQGRKEFPVLLRNALANGTIESLEASIFPFQHLNYEDFQPVDAFTWKIRKMPRNAIKLLALEFNYYYMIAICRRAIKENKRIRVYRGRISLNPRKSSEKLIGKFLSPRELLETLRPVETENGKYWNWNKEGFPQINSGLTIELV